MEAVTVHNHEMLQGDGGKQGRNLATAATVPTAPAMPHAHFFHKQGSKSDMMKSRRPTIEKIIPGVDIIKNVEFAKNNKGETVRYPRVKQFAHFHYDHVEFDTIQALVDTDNDDDDLYAISVSVNKKMWMVHRGYEHMKVLDTQLHSCVYDRKFSQLPDLTEFIPDSVDHMNKAVADYLTRFTELSCGQPLNCGTVLNFFEVDNRGNRLVGTDESSAINIPAIAAAQTIKAYTSQAPDELSLEVGDMVSVIDKPRPEESTWWRGKKRFEVGFFPSECVEIIGVKVPSRGQHAETKPVLAKRGKLITFLRMFFSNRPQRSTLKQNGIVKERVYGCDLAEHLANSSLNVPHVLSACCNVIELHGLIDGIYRLSGVASNIQKLRAEFDEGSITSLIDEEMFLDLHTITAVLKMYFRELPNPLLTYQLYESFSDAVALKGDERLLKIKSIISRLPPPHYRTARFLFSHLHRMSMYGSKTGMDSRNLAIVWSPNLMRSKAMESGNVNGAQMLHCVSVQATVVEALISSYEYAFSDDEPIFRQDEPDNVIDMSDMPTQTCPPPQSDTVQDLSPSMMEHLYENVEALSVDETYFDSEDDDVNTKKPRPSSVAVSTPSRLITLTEAQDRLHDSQQSEDRSNSYNGETGSDIIPVFHTVIDFERKSVRESGGSSRDSGGGGGNNSNNQSTSSHTHIRDKSPSRWKALFNRSRPSSLKNKKKRTQSVDSHDDITDNEIGHLSRRITDSSSSSNVHLGRISGSFSDLPVISAKEPGLRRASSSAGVEDEPGMTKSASHESFFEPPLIPGPHTSPPPTPPDPLKDLTQGITKTPGVVMRPAYQNPIGDLFKQPKAVWKGSTNPRAHMANSSKDLVQSQQSIYHTLQSQGSKTLQHNQKHPYLSPALAIKVGEEVQPLSLDHSPGAQRKQVRCFSHTDDQQAFYADEENPYETIGPPRVPPTNSQNTQNTTSNLQNRTDIQQMNNSNNQTSSTNQDTHIQNMNSQTRTVSVRNKQPQQQAKQPESFSRQDTSSVAIDKTEMERLQLEWEDSEMMQCMNQANQARLSRSFSAQTASSDRSRRTYSDSHYNTDSTVTSDANPYVNTYIDSVVVKETGIVPAQAAKTLASINDPTSIRAPTSHEKTQISPSSTPPMLDNRDQIRQHSVPKSNQAHLDRCLDSIEGRPRSNSTPYRRSPSSSRRKESDVDTAIANAPDVSKIASKAPRKPSRKMEYVNMKTYEPDTRKYRGHEANRSSDEGTDCSPSNSYNPRVSELSRSYHSGTTSSSSSASSSDIGVSLSSTPPVTENMKPRPLSQPRRQSMEIGQTEGPESLYENLPPSHTQHRQSNKTPVVSPRVSLSSEADSGEDKNGRPVPRQRRISPPQTAPRSNPSTSPPSSDLDNSYTGLHNSNEHKPIIEEHHSRLVISFNKPDNGMGN